VAEQGELFPFVSIVIPAYNATRTIRMCLDSILQQDYPKDRCEVIVVDNNSKDGTPEIVKQYPVTLVYEHEQQGPHAATNSGIRAAKGEILVFTDSDCIAEQGWLRAMVKPFEDENVVGVGGRIEAYQPTSRVEKFLAYEVKPFANCVQMADSFPAALLTGNAAWRAEVIRAVGLFNANLYTGSEVDLSWRIQWHTGKKVAQAEGAVVYHLFSPNVRRLFRHFQIYGYSEVILATMYKDMPGYPRTPSKQLHLMLSQCRSILIYMASFFYRSITAPFRRKGWDYVTSPLLWLVSETGSIYGKLEAMWQTRYYRKQFWANGPKVI
jgi:cellulose synthase/poly-beta-1,6-N-acetylglucosamine synthase-like glycosyltransferase